MPVHCSHQTALITARDIAVVTWVARHGMVTEQQVASRFFASRDAATRRLRQLEDLRLAHRALVWRGMPAIIRASGRGIALCGIDLQPAALDVARVRHSLAVCDLAEDLLAHTVGARWRTEREVRRDRMRQPRGAHWRSPRRTPDGVLLTTFERLAVELDLTPKRSGKLELLVGTYAVDPDIDRVLWYLPSETSVWRMQEVVAARGLQHLIQPRLRRVAPLPW